MIIFSVPYILAFFFLTSSALGSMNVQDLVTEIDEIIASKVPNGEPLSPAAVIAALDDPAMKQLLRKTVVKSFPFSLFRGHKIMLRGVEMAVYHKIKLADVKLTVTRKLPLGTIISNYKYSIERPVDEIALERYNSLKLKNLIGWAGIVFLVHLAWIIFGEFEEVVRSLFFIVGATLGWNIVLELIFANFII